MRERGREREECDGNGDANISFFLSFSLSGGLGLDIATGLYIGLNKAHMIHVKVNVSMTLNLSLELDSFFLLSSFFLLFTHNILSHYSSTFSPSPLFSKKGANPSSSGQCAALRRESESVPMVVFLRA